jgi:extracellular elastinolytic metalloproteinase
MKIDNDFQSRKFIGWRLKPEFDLFSPPKLLCMGKFYSAAIVFLALFFVCEVKAQDVTEKSVQDLVKTHAAQLHITSTDANNVVINSYFTDPGTGILYSYIQQTWNGIRVYNTIITAAFRNNQLLYSAGKFVNDIATKAGQAAPSIAAEQAVIRSAEHLQLPRPVNLQVVDNKFSTDKKIVLSPASIAKQNITAELFWLADDELKTVKLAWNVNIDVAGSPDWWNVRIDAMNGAFIDKDNWTVHENISNIGNDRFNRLSNRVSKSRRGITGFNAIPPTSITNAGYYVVRFPGESPVSGTLGVDNQPWLKAGVGNNAVTHGWHYDGVTDYDITRGNNVFAYLDINNSNNASTTNYPDTSSTPIPSLTFNNLPAFTNEPSTVQNRKFALDNLFYWNNLMHDVMYQYGFNEVSGNFQSDNLGRGGSGNDFVRAEAQDASGTNNANFATPGDGSSGRMQMYLFSRVPSLTVNTPAVIAGDYTTVESGFSTANKLINIGPVSGTLVYYNDNAAGTTHEACVIPVNSIVGKIAVIVRGNCNFTDKVKNAQNAGAIAVVMVNNVPGDPIIMGGTDNTITIPAVMISQEDGNTITAQINNNVTVTLTAGVNRDGDLDAGVVCHEFGHGISNRLTGGRTNASCLQNAEQGGEGWSDYFALMMVTNWSTAQLTDGNLSRSMATYVLGQNSNGTGLRTYPYSYNLTVDPHTYTDVAANPESHYIGEVWTSALWDMTWNIIQQEGAIEPNIYNASSNGGNAIALKLVMEGLRLQTCRPGFLDARNAILAADSILYNYRHKCAIWNAFARRGMGYSAVQGNSNSATDQVSAFDVPSSVTLAKTTTPAVVDQSAQVTVNLSASCGCLAPANNYVIRDTIPSGFSYVSSTGGTLNGNIVTFTPVNFTNTLETRNFSITLQPTSGCSVDTSINDNRDGSSIGGLTPAAAVGSTLWIPSNNRFSSPSNSWFAANPATTSDFTLTSNAFTAGSLSVLAIKHYYVIENAVDGGRIEITTDNGANWIDAGPYIVQNGYNTTTIIGSPWGSGQRIFSGVSYGQGTDQFITTIVNLSSFSGQSVRVRFRMQTNATNASNSTYEGWYIDDIVHINGCGGIVKAGLYNSTATLVDNTVNPIFVRGTANAVVTFATQPNDAAVCENNSVSFTAAATGTPSPTYKWQVSTDGGGTFNDIPGQTSATLTFIPTAAMQGNKYRSIATNGLTSATSNVVTLTVNRLVTVSAHPNNAGVCGGTNASFAVTATGAGTLTYKWQVSTDNGATYNDVAGQTTATMTIAATNAMNGNKFRSVITGTCGSVTSNAATLTVSTQVPVTIVTVLPSRICTSDSAIALVATPVGGAWSGTGVTGSSFVPSTTAPGTHTLTYTYTNTNGCTTVATTIAKLEDCPERKLTLANNAMILFPNPNNGRFKIKMNSTLYTSLGMKVYASNGALVRSQQISGLSFGQTTDITLLNVAAGVYLVKFYASDGTETTFKVVIGTH